ncbi:cystathionine beta-lyase [Streptococcus dentapri]|uniref:Cystathionine beta-lyase n=1 Tax=Streptococcus dentapri TaxID=573564 RepID=A0ABV8D269_9STRE
MTDVMELALKYGGFTSLDKVYLTNVLAQLSPEAQLLFVTPPPSVLNAYFSEIYQKQGPEAATAYYLELSQSYNWLQSHPSFDEHQPFVRLNLSGKSFAFVYESADEVALVFSEKKETITGELLLELAKLFPHYKIYQEDSQIKMRPLVFDEKDKEVVEDLSTDVLLTDLVRLKGNIIKLSGYNAQEVLELGEDLSAKVEGPVYYAFQQREFAIYFKEKD